MDLGIPSPPKRRLSLTPLIDVVFILLLFFMLASSFIEWREVELTLAGSKGEQTAEQALRIQLIAKGMLLDGIEMSKEQLLQKIRTAIKENPERAVVIQPESQRPLQELVNLLDQLRTTGAHRVSLMRPAEDN